MAGLIICGDYGTINPFITRDDSLYREIIGDLKIKEVRRKPFLKVYFKKGGVSTEQLGQATDKLSEIVKKLNEHKKVNIKEELSKYFN